MTEVEGIENDEGPPIKRLKHLNLVSEFLKIKEDEETSPIQLISDDEKFE